MSISECNFCKIMFREKHVHACTNDKGHDFAPKKYTQAEHELQMIELLDEVEPLLAGDDVTNSVFRIIKRRISQGEQT